MKTTKVQLSGNALKKAKLLSIGQPSLKAVMTIDLNNASFQDDIHNELSKIFEDMKERIYYGNLNDPYIIRDTNGNNVGEFKIIKDENKN
jgi:hypothetical protein